MFGFRSSSLAALLAVSSFLFSPGSALSLEEVLSKQTNVTTFAGLVKNHTDIFKDLPKGVTIAVPNDNAFRKLGNWETYNESMVEATLKYHTLTKSVSMTSIKKGDSIWVSTTLNDPSLSTVTNGQRLILTKQPGGEVVFTSGFATRGTVLVEDLAFDNGLVQIIDSVMRVPETLESTARNAYTDLTAFLGALYATNVIDEVVAQTDLTIFAPHNAAFQQLAGAFSALDAESLKKILRYHIVPGNLTHVWELQNSSSLVTAQNNKTLHITRHTNFIYVNSAEIIQTDILIANGIVHMIDNVLSPDEADAKPDVTKTAQLPVFTPVGETATGTDAPTPYVTYLPCTASCPVPEGPKTTGGVGDGVNGEGEGAESSNAGVAGPRCTGVVRGMGVGLVIGAVMAGL